MSIERIHECHMYPLFREKSSHLTDNFMKIG